MSSEAQQLARDSLTLDLHIDTWIPRRLWGYDPLRRHRSALLGRWCFGHLDLPRMRDGGLKGAMWSITTNPLRTRRGRWTTFLRNVEGLDSMIQSAPGELAWASSPADLRRLHQEGAHAVMLAVQGGNALEGGSPDRWPAQLTRVTLVHLTSSVYGESSCPLRLLHPARGLTAAGAELVEALNERRVWVDLAHAHPRTFWAALEHHSPQLPPIVTHTGVSGVKPIWRNLSDEQVRAIADRGGVIGVIFSEHFLKPSRRADGLECIALHLEHLQRIGGERCAALGSDYDGAIVPPRAIAGGQYPLLIQLLLDRGWSAERIQGVLGKNYLKSWESLLS